MLKAEAVIWCVPTCPLHNHPTLLHTAHAREQPESLGFSGCQQACFALNSCLSEQDWWKSHIFGECQMWACVTMNCHQLSDMVSKNANRSFTVDFHFTYMWEVGTRASMKCLSSSAWVIKAQKAPVLGLPASGITMLYKEFKSPFLSTESFFEREEWKFNPTDLIEESVRLRLQWKVLQHINYRYFSLLCMRIHILCYTACFLW